MAYRRRARVAERFPGLDVLVLNPTDLRVYDELIRTTDAERILADPAARPDRVEAAVFVLTGDLRQAQAAAARCRLELAAKKKGF